MVTAANEFLTGRVDVQRILARPVCPLRSASLMTTPSRQTRVLRIAILLDGKILQERLIQ